GRLDRAESVARGPSVPGPGARTGTADPGRSRRGFMVDSFEQMFDTEHLMATLSPDVTAALATLRSRWGAAAPRAAGEVAGALALAPAIEFAADRGVVPAGP